MLNVVGDDHQVQVFGRDLALSQYPVADPLLQPGPIAGAEHDHREVHDLPRLDQRQRLEEFVHGAEAAREDDEGFRVLDEHRLAHEEVVELDAEVDELVEALFERQLDVEADRQATAFTGTPVGRFHGARAAARDDGEAPAGELGRQRAGGIVHRVGRPNACRSEEGDGRTDGGERIEAGHELRLDTQHPPGVAFQELRGSIGPLKQLAVLDLPLHATTDDASGPPLFGLFAHCLANSTRSLEESDYLPAST